MNFKYKNILALTTDPIDMLRGYSLVFYKIFDFIDENYKDINTILFSNQGNSSQLVRNKNFKHINIKPSDSNINKSFRLFNFFVSQSRKYSNKDTVIVVNLEIPELVAGVVLKYIFGFNVFVIVHDLQIRVDSYELIFVDFIRKINLFLINKLIFVNNFTLKSVWWVKSQNKYLIGNPIF